MASVLALVAAASWGGSDFLGGLAGRRAGRDISLASALLGSLLGLAGLWVIAAIVGGAPMTRSDLVYAAGAGVGSAAGVSLLYRGLTIGKMGVVAPITGAGAVALPVVVSTVTGDPPPALAWLGIVFALSAIALVSREQNGDTTGTAQPAHRWPPGLVEAIGSGLGFGVLFTLLGRTAEATNLWPLVPMRLSTVVVLVLAILGTRSSFATPRLVWPHLLGIGMLDNLANVAYLLSTRVGVLALVAVISALYPVGTVLLARVVLHERLLRHQVAGLVLAVAAVVLISLA